MSEELSFNDRMSISISLGNRIDSYWQRYLYMNLAFALAFTVISENSPPLAVIVVFLVYFLSLLQTGRALVNTYGGLNAILSDYNNSTIAVENNQNLDVWVRGFNFKWRVIEIIVLYIISVVGMSAIAFWPKSVEVSL